MGLNYLSAEDLGIGISICQYEPFAGLILVLVARIMKMKIKEKKVPKKEREKERKGLVYILRT